MLIRISGGKEGIKEYLEKGQKSGREFSRDELDERIILDGDLDFTHQLISEMQGDAERYLHITLAFKEDAVSEEFLRTITEEFKVFTFSAYGMDEINMYAEAHIPKIKSYLSKKNGELIERKPHIHVVIPKTNLMSGTVVNPFGLVERNEKFIDAFQEHINNKFGLASPKNNRRVTFTNESDMIQRLKDDAFDGQNKEVKEAILAAVLERKIVTHGEFEVLLTEFGELKTRNRGKDNAYHNVKPEGYAKGINLKDYVFSRGFIELPTADKIQRLTAEVERKYEVEGKKLRDPELIRTTLAEWHRFRAKEIKYINSGNARLYRRYTREDATPEWRESILEEQARKFYQYYRKPEHESRKQTEKNPFEADYRYKQRDQNPREIELPAGRAEGRRTRLRPRSESLSGQRIDYDGDREYDVVSLTHFEETQTIDRVRTLSSLDMVRNPNEPEVLLSVDARDQLEQRGTRGNATLRWGSNRERGRLTSSGRDSDTVVSQYRRDLHEEQLLQDAITLAEFANIRRELGAHRLLAELSISHGVITEKYSVSQAKDGSDRIQCGRRQYNVSDFLTREMRLSWDESATILRESFLRQLAKEPITAPIRNPTLTLWRAFHQERVEGEHHQTMASQYASERARLSKLKQELQQQKTAAAKMPIEEKKSTLAIAQMNFIVAEAALKLAIKIERAQLRTPIGIQYQHYLHTRASEGDEKALTELRRMKSRFEPNEAYSTNSIEGAGRSERNELIYRKREVKFVVQKNGDVLYTIGGKHALRDDGYKLHLLETDRLSIEIGLRLAVEKFDGQSIVVNGSKDFKAQVSKVAAETGLKLIFQEPELNNIMRLRLSELVLGRTQTANQRQLKIKIDADVDEVAPRVENVTVKPLKVEVDLTQDLKPNR